MTEHAVHCMFSLRFQCTTALDFNVSVAERFLHGTSRVLRPNETLMRLLTRITKTPY